MTDVLKRIQEYEKIYTDDYGFEQEMVKARQMYLKEFILEYKPKSILEVGCGSDFLFNQLAECDFIESWIIVEPSEDFVNQARQSIQDSRVQVINGFIEEVLKNQSIEKVDLCLCSSLLHEVKKPQVILSAAKSIMKASGLIHINVPNAASMHRKLAEKMGLIDSIHQFSERNKMLLQSHIFDATSLSQLVSDSGFEKVSQGGYFVKPFSHAQMEKVVEVLGDDILLGLYHLGREMPEIASEIYINAGLPA